MSYNIKHMYLFFFVYTTKKNSIFNQSPPQSLYNYTYSQDTVTNTHI